MGIQDLILSNINPEDLQRMIRDAVTDALKKQKEIESSKKDEELMTRTEVAKLYKTSLVTLRQWEVDGIIPKPIRKGTRVYFRKSDIYNDINSKDKN